MTVGLKCLGYFTLGFEMSLLPCYWCRHWSSTDVVIDLLMMSTLIRWWCRHWSANDVDNYLLMMSTLICYWCRH